MSLWRPLGARVRVGLVAPPWFTVTYATAGCGDRQEYRRSRTHALKRRHVFDMDLKDNAGP